MNLPIYAKVDLTAGRWEPFEIPRDYFKKYVGGKCLAARLLLDLTPPGLDPLSPEAVIIINTGHIASFQKKAYAQRMAYAIV